MPRRRAFTRTMSSAGMPSVMQTTSAMPASAASRIASAANGGGTKITDAFAPVGATARRPCRRPGRPRSPCPPRPGRHARRPRCVPYVERRRAVEASRRPGDPLHEQSRVRVAAGRHRCPTRSRRLRLLARDRRCRPASSVAPAGAMREPALARISRPSSTLVPSSRTTSGTVSPTAPRGGDHALGDDVAAARCPPKMFTSIPRTLRVARG